MTKDRIELINNNSSNKENYNQLSIQEWQSLPKDLQLSILKSRFYDFCEVKFLQFLLA